MHDYVAGNKTAYEEEKERWSESLIRRAEELVIPGLSSMIDVKVTASPLTNRAFTATPKEHCRGHLMSTQRPWPVPSGHLARQPHPGHHPGRFGRVNITGIGVGGHGDGEIRVRLDLARFRGTAQ